MRGREAGGGGSRKCLAAHSSSAEAVSRKFRQWVDFAFLMARKYVRSAAMTVLREVRSGSEEVWIGSGEVQIGSSEVWIGAGEVRPELGSGGGSGEVWFGGTEEEERLDRWRRAAAWKSARSVERSSDHHGLDQHEDFRRGTERQRVALRLFKVAVTHFSGSLGEGSMGRAKR